MHRILLILISLLSWDAIADYGWLPKEKSLVARLGMRFISSSENFDSGGFREDIRFQNAPMKFTENSLQGEAEYTFAKGWSAGFKAGFGQSLVKPLTGGAALLSANGIGDMHLSFKRNFRLGDPVITLEGVITIPTQSTAAAADELLSGNGAFETGIIAHTGIRMKHFFFAISPGFLARAAGYASALTLSGVAGGFYNNAYGYLALDWFGSLGDDLLKDSALTVHDANGTGGSQLRLAGSPTVSKIGLVLGSKIYNNYGAEIHWYQTLTGNRAPHYSSVTLNIRAVFDFYKPDGRIPIREVPFDRDSPMFPATDG